MSNLRNSSNGNNETRADTNHKKMYVNKIYNILYNLQYYKMLIERL